MSKYIYRKAKKLLKLIESDLLDADADLVWAMFAAALMLARKLRIAVGAESLQEVSKIIEEEAVRELGFQ